MAQRIRALLDQISGMKMRYRMFFIYIIGGALPSIVIALYLIHGMSEILVDQAKRAEVTELEMIRSQTEDMTETVSTVTKYFYFDKQMEEIATRQYSDYLEMVQDYKAFTSFLDYGKYYNNIVAWINVYMKNDTLVGNSRFVKVTEEIEQEEWYREAAEKKGGALWCLRTIPSTDYSNYNALTLVRMLKTRKGMDVGVLAVYIRPERFEVLLQDRGCDTFVILNGETVVVRTGEKVDAEQIREFLPDGSSRQVQESIFLGRQEYVMTCETIPLAESEDYLQVVSFKAYRDILREVNSRTMQSILLFVFSVGISVTVIIVFANLFSHRVERFREQMQKAAGGSFELEKELGGRDEISDLYNYLGTMILQIQRLLAEVYQERLHAERLTVRQKDAEFKMLASQINPHFLYNTLETIRMRARRSRQYDIEEIVSMLARLLRSTLQAGAREVTMKTEMELAEYYLRIQQYRFEERIQYHIHVEEGLETLPILPLIIQPIVENSIIHGLECKVGVGTINIRAARREYHVVITIEDDGVGMSEEKLAELRNKLNSYSENGRHIGVSNVHQRVKLRYGEGCGVRIDSGKGCGTKVEILLPDVEELQAQK